MGWLGRYHVFESFPISISYGLFHILTSATVQKMKKVKFPAKATYLGERQQKLLTQSREEFGVIRHLQISVGQGDWQLRQSHSRNPIQVIGGRKNPPFQYHGLLVSNFEK